MTRTATYKPSAAWIRWGAHEHPGSVVFIRDIVNEGKHPAGKERLVTYVIGESCVDVLDRACVEECPVDCIHGGERMLYPPGRVR